MNIKVVSKPNCAGCSRIKNKMDSANMEYEEIDLTTVSKETKVEILEVASANGHMFVPMIFVDGNLVRVEEFEAQYLK